MSRPTPRSIVTCSVLAGLAVLSACSDDKPANVSFQDIDRTNIPSNIVANSDLSESSTEWTGWRTNLLEDNGALASFALQAPGANPPGNSLRANVMNVEASSTPEEISAGPVAVPVTPGGVYGVGAFVTGPACSLARFVVHAAGDPENILAEQEVFLSGESQAVNYYFQVPDEGVTSVDLPVHLAFADNLDSSVYIDRIVAIPTVMPRPAAEGNVATNSNFEDSDDSISIIIPETTLNSWSNTTTSNATFTLISDSEEAQDGNNFVQIEFGSVGSGNPWDIEAGPINVPVVRGWTYTFSAWIKGDEGAQANFLVQNPSQYNVFNEQRVTVTPEWQEVRFEATITGTNVVRLFTQYNFPENTNKTIYIDNIRLIPPDTCPYAPVVSNLVSSNANLFEFDHVVNGGLEAGDTVPPLGWNTQVTGAAEAEFAVQTVDINNRTLVNSGDRSLKTTINLAGDNAWDIQAGPTDLIVVPGQTYIYSGFARGAEGTQANFTAALQGAPYTIFEEQLVSFNGFWRQVTFDFTVPADAPVLTAEELSEARLPSDAAVTRMRMAVNMSYPENVGKRILLDEFTLLPNAAVNGDLENSDSAAVGWTMQAVPSSLASFELDSTESHTGNNSLRIDIAEIAADAVINLADIQAGITDISVEGGRTYYISARVKANAAARVKMLLSSAESPYEEYGAVGGNLNDDSMPEGFAVTADWQEITFEADIPEGVETVRLLAQMGFAANSRRSIYLDSFRVVSQIPPPPKAETANLVTNGGLENGRADGWNGNNASIAVTTSPEGVYSGNFGLHVTGRTADWNSAQYNLLNAGLQGGNHYMASAWVKVDGDIADNLKLTLQVTHDDGTNDYISLSETGEANTLGWTKLSGFFDYPSDDITDIKLYIEAAGPETSYFIDELFVTRMFTPNGNLEAGDIMGWNNSGAAQIAIAMDEVHSGTYSLHVTGRTDTWHSAQYDLLSSGMQPGRTYQISAWVKIDGDTADNLKMTVEMADDSDGEYRYLTIAQSSDTEEWVKLSNTYTYAPVGEPTVFKVYFEGDSETSSYYIDDLVIIEVIPPVNLISNGDIELGRTSGWNGNNATIAETRSAQGVYSGNFGLHVTGRTDNWNSAQYGLNEAGLEEGASYLASAWVRVDGDTADNLKLTLQISYEDAETQYISIAETGPTGTLSWTKLSGVINYVPIGIVTDVRVYIEAAGDTTDYFIDDLIIQKMYTPNGGLESGLTTGWNPSGDAQIAVAADESFSGDFSLYVSDRTANWNSAQYDLLNSGMEVGKTYDISAWVKIDGDVADIIRMTIEVQDDDNESNQYLTIAQSADTLDWVRLSSKYTYAPDGTATVFKVYFEAGEAGSSYFIDDLVITEAGESYEN